MAKTTNIEWADASWNPWIGCTPVSLGCQNCYMHRWAKRAGKDPNKVQIASLRSFNAPRRWMEPKRIIVCSLGDFFHKEADNSRHLAVNLMLELPRHTFIIPTKRPERIIESLYEQTGGYYFTKGDSSSNIWILASVENQEMADKRIPELLKLREYGDWPVLGVSVEPMLGEIHIEDYLFPEMQDGMDWIIIGAESGPNRRECKIEWVRNLVEQGKEAGVPVFIKQLHINGRVSKDMSEWPEDLRIRDNPPKG